MGYVLEAQQEEHADVLGGETRGGQAEAADRVRVAVDAGGEGGEVAGFEHVGGVGEEGDDRGGALRLRRVEDVVVVIVIVRVLQWRPVIATACHAQRQRILADQDLENGGVAALQPRKPNEA